MFEEPFHSFDAIRSISAVTSLQMVVWEAVLVKGIVIANRKILLDH